MACVGIDIGGSSVKAVRVEADQPGAFSADRSHAMASVRTAHDGASVESLIEAIRAAGESVGLAAGDSVGACLPGLFDADSGRVHRCANLAFLEGASIREVLESALGSQPETLMTDASAWGLGASRRSPVSGRLLVLAIGTGVGGALLDSGELVTLDGVTPGHIGMMDVSLSEHDRPVAGDGTPGVLEAYIGGRALHMRFPAGALADAIAGMDADDVSIRALVRGLRICHAIYKPDTIRLVGGIGAMFGEKLALIDRLVRARLTSVAKAGWTLDTVDDPFLAALGVAAGRSG